MRQNSVTLRSCGTQNNTGRKTMNTIDCLKTVLREDQIYPGEPMSRHTTFRTGGPAECLVTPGREQMSGLIRCLNQNQIPYTVIGNGSNLLVGDGGIDGVVIEIGGEMAGITIHGQEMHVEAGALMSAAAMRALEAGLSGFECESGIPGSIGGAVVMNAGAYGGEMKDVLRRVEVLTREGDRIEMDAAELDLSYRHSNIPERNLIVLSAVLALTPADPAQIRARMDELKEQRVSKQPLEYPSAGSTFKRPEGYFAGKLIQDAGLRGYTVGGAQVSEKHCGFVINRGDATSAQIRQLIRDVQQNVQQKFGVALETEVRFLGKF